MPAAALAATVVDVEELWGALAVELVDRVRAATTWEDRFAVLDDVLARVAASADERALPSPELAEAWRLLTTRSGRPVARVAREVGWSRRHLSQRFVSEFGVGPKQLDRIVRFERAVVRLKAPRRPSLATVAAECGYADQAHMARDWRELAGCSPSEWLAAEVLPFVRDDEASPAHARATSDVLAGPSRLERRGLRGEVEVVVEVRGVVEPAHDPAVAGDDEVGDRRVVAPDEGERVRRGDGLGHDLADHAAVADHDDPLVGMGGDDALDRAAHRARAGGRWTRPRG